MSEVRVRGAATREEVAAVAAVLAARSRVAPSEDAYTRWRRVRLAALRPPDDTGSGSPRR